MTVTKNTRIPNFAVALALSIVILANSALSQSCLGPRCFNSQKEMDFIEDSLKAYSLGNNAKTGKCELRTH